MDKDVTDDTRRASRAFERTDYPVNDDLALKNASGSLEILGQLALNEWELLRHRIRELGTKIRQMSSKVAAATVQRLWQQLLWLLSRHSESVPRQFDLDAAMILNEMEKPEQERPPPRDTLLDIRRVILENTDEDGVVHRKWAAARWTMPPPRRQGANSSAGGSEHESSPYQLFNRPMTIDDDFDRLSLPSTHFGAQSESDKILSLEAQLALLTRQLNMIMVNGIPQNGSASARPSRPGSRSGSSRAIHPPPLQEELPTYESLHHHRRSLSSSEEEVEDEEDNGYLQDDTGSSYASPTECTGDAVVAAPHAPAPYAPSAPALPPLSDTTNSVAAPSIRDRRMTTAFPSGDHPSGDLSITIPPAVTTSGAPPLKASPSSTSLPIDIVNPGAAAFGAPDSSFSSPSLCSSPFSTFSPPLPPPPACVTKLQKELQPGLQRVNTHESTLSSQAGSGRSFLDEINAGNFNLRKTSPIRSPLSSSGDEEHDENAQVGPLVKPTMKQLLTRKDSLRRISTDRSPGGTPQNRGRRRPPSLGLDGGSSLLQGDYLRAALVNKFQSIHVNDDDTESTAGDQSWVDE